MKKKFMVYYKRNKQTIKLCIIMFFIIIIIKVIGEKFIGNGYIGFVGPYDPLEWRAIFYELPQTIFIALLLTIAFAWVYTNGKKIDDKKWDDIRKKNKKGD